MELSIVCPLCYQPGFSDVNALWLTLIRATTRQLSCPVCQEILCGLDKLTIHLVSHSLHDQMVQACLATNLLPAPEPATALPCPKNEDLSNSNNTSSKEPMQVSNVLQSKSENAVASYVLINFPTLENVPVETSSQETGVGQVTTDVTEHEKLSSSLPSQNVDLSVLSSCKDSPQTKATFPPFLHSKPNDIVTTSNVIGMSQNLPSQVTDPVKFVTFSLPMSEANNPSELSFKGKIGEKLFTPDRSVESHQNAHSQYMMQHR